MASTPTAQARRSSSARRRSRPPAQARPGSRERRGGKRSRRHDHGDGNAQRHRRPTPPRPRSAFRATARPSSRPAAERSRRPATRSRSSGGTDQTATFDNFTISNLSGDLIFADPSIATVNFNNTTANAGTNNLLYATGGQRDHAERQRLDADRRDPHRRRRDHQRQSDERHDVEPDRASTVTNLNVTNSIIVFAPPGSGGGFKTLTVSNYAGSARTSP